MPTPFDREQFLEALAALADFQKPDDPTVNGWSAPRKRSILKGIVDGIEYLEKMRLTVEGIHLPSFVFDLSNPNIAAATIVHRLEGQDPQSLPSLRGQRFFGSGVYALYYSGSFPAYGAISNTQCPIYVGSASPVDKTADTPRKQKTGLFDRLMHHLTRSIAMAKTTLDPAHFSCKYLLVQTGLELAAEQLLMRQYHPVWNKEEKVCAGFGKHGDKAESSEATTMEDEGAIEDNTSGGEELEIAGEEATVSNVGGRKEKSRWDILHPGRPWANSQTSRKGITARKVIVDIQAHFLRLLGSDHKRWSEIFNPAWSRNSRSNLFSFFNNRNEWMGHNLSQLHWHGVSKLPHA
ncbi:MAG TPA: Eco29kI family restriction endonuclease, partial [Gemmata sp.]|nr:Eco29kI family restriction endonuclease [Gemmata sp.]